VVLNVALDQEIQAAIEGAQSLLDNADQQVEQGQELVAESRRTVPAALKRIRTQR
jgi:hypothetical protein